MCQYDVTVGITRSEVICFLSSKPASPLPKLELPQLSNLVLPVEAKRIWILHLSGQDSRSPPNCHLRYTMEQKGIQKNKTSIDESHFWVLSQILTWFASIRLGCATVCCDTSRRSKMPHPHQARCPQLEQIGKVWVPFQSRDNPISDGDMAQDSAGVSNLKRVSWELSPVLLDSTSDLQPEGNMMIKIHVFFISYISIVFEVARTYICLWSARLSELEFRCSTESFGSILFHILAFASKNKNRSQQCMHQFFGVLGNQRFVLTCVFFSFSSLQSSPLSWEVTKVFPQMWSCSW